MRAIVRAPISPPCGSALYNAVIVLALLTHYTLAILSITLLYIFDCSENATAELGRSTRYQAHWPVSIPLSTGR